MRVVTWNVNGLRPFAQDPSTADVVAEAVGGADILALQEAKLTAAQLTRATDGRFAQRIACLARPGPGAADASTWSACLSLHPHRGYAGVVSYARLPPVRAAEGLTPHPPPTSAPVPIPIPPADYAQPSSAAHVWCACAGFAPDGTTQPPCPRLAALLRLNQACSTAPPTNVDSEGRALVTVHRIRPAPNMPGGSNEPSDLPQAITLFNIYAPNETRSDRVPFKLSFYTALTRTVAAAAASPAPPIVVGDLNVIASALDKAWSDEWPQEVEQAAINALQQQVVEGDPTDADELPDCGCRAHPRRGEWCWCLVGTAAWRAAHKAAPQGPSHLPNRIASSTPDETTLLDALPSWLGALLSRTWLHSLTRGPLPLLRDLFKGAQSEASRFTCWSVKFDLRRANFGCRLDYVLAHPNLARYGVTGTTGSVAEVVDAQGSDHAPVAARFAFELCSPSPCPQEREPSVHPWLIPDLRLLPSNWPAFQSQGTIEALFAQAAPHTNESRRGASARLSPLLKEGHATRKKAQSSTTRQLSMRTFFSRPGPQERLQPSPPTGLADGAGPTSPASPLPPESPILDHLSLSSDACNADARRAWSQLLSANPRPPPLCYHGEPAKQARVSKAGRNKGRTFWFCARPIALGPGAEANPPLPAASRLGSTRCAFFRWDR